MLKTLTKALYRFIVYSGGKIPDFVDVHASCKRNGFILRKRSIHARNSRITCVQKRCFAFSVGSISAAFSSPAYVHPRVRSAGSFLEQRLACFQCTQYSKIDTGSRRLWYHANLSITRIRTDQWDDNVVLYTMGYVTTICDCHVFDVFLVEGNVFFSIIKRRCFFSVEFWPHVQPTHAQLLCLTICIFFFIFTKKIYMQFRLFHFRLKQLRLRDKAVFHGLKVRIARKYCKEWYIFE